MQQLGQAIKPIPRYPQSETASKEDNNIAMALIAFHQTNPHAYEDKRNPHFKNKYASLESVIKTVRTQVDIDSTSFSSAVPLVVLV